MLIRARSLVNSFHTTIRTPPEILCTISSYFTEEDLFSASQVCRHWRSVLVSSASLWTRISYNRRPGRAIASFARCGSLPIQLLLEPPFPSAFLEGVLLHGNKIISLTVDHKPFWISQLQSLLTFSRPSVERLILLTTDFRERTPDDQIMHEIWQDFPHLRELFVASHPVPIGRFAAPNLAHLALESTICLQKVTAQTILDMLRGCPLLETLLLNYSNIIPPITPYGHSPVRLPHLRSIEVGSCEVYSGLITHLDFPLVVAGFRHMPPDYLCGQIPPTVLASMQHVLGRVDIRYVTLAAHLWNEYLSIRFEALHGSLEITTAYLIDYHWQPTDILFSPEGVLFSHSPRIENVTEIRIIDCPFDANQGLDHVGAAMPNVHTISIRCSTSHAFGLLTSESPSALPFPRLERVMVLGTELGLEMMAGRRRDLGVPLKTVVIGRDPKGPKYDRLADYTILEELVDDLRVGCPVEIFEWEIGKEIVGFWSAAGVPESVGLNKNLIALGLMTSTVPFCRITKQL